MGNSLPANRRIPAPNIVGNKGNYNPLLCGSLYPDGYQPLRTGTLKMAMRLSPTISVVRRVPANFLPLLLTSRHPEPRTIFSPFSIFFGAIQYPFLLGLRPTASSEHARSFQRSERIFSLADGARDQRIVGYSG